MQLTRFDDVLAALKQHEAALPQTAGSRLAHCAQSIECLLTGFPQMRAWPIRAFIGPMLLKKFLRQGFMKHDVTAGIAGVPEAPADVSVAEGVARLTASIAAFHAHSGELHPHFAYGPLSRAEAEAVQSMHVAEHLTALLADAK